jgi:glycosyltransferase involved in cell wall biosynthesis
MLRPARIVAVSDATARAFPLPGALQSRVTTIHNGIDLNRFPLKSTGASETVRKELGVPAEAFLVCAVGQVCERKGLLELVQAFGQAHTMAPDMHLVLAGSVVFEHERDYFNRVRAAASVPAIASHVHFVGEIEDVSALLQAADLLVLNSKQEPFGLVLVEAMSSGTPVLAARVGGVPEIVNDSLNGWLVERGDTAALAAKLVELVQRPDLLRRIAITARCETCQQFSLQRFQHRLNRLYAELDRTPNSVWNARNRPAIAVDSED